MNLVIHTAKKIFKKGMTFAQKTFIKWTAPAKSSQIKGAVLDLTRNKAELIAENAPWWLHGPSMV